MINTADYDFQNANGTSPSTLSFNEYILKIDGKKIRGSLKFDYYQPGDLPTDPNTKPIPGLTFGPYKVNGDLFNFFKR